MAAEFRLIITATFIDAVKRNNAAAAMKTQIQNYNTANPGNIKVAHITKDDYYVAENPTNTEKLV